jgi:hypothetical protein
VPGSRTEGVGRGAPQTSQGIVRSFPNVADASQISLRLPSGIRGIGLTPLDRALG